MSQAPHPPKKGEKLIKLNVDLITAEQKKDSKCFD
jgi:hypothetical protein